jgi:hypothetical protein
VIRSSGGNVPGVASEPRPQRWNQGAGLALVSETELPNIQIEEFAMAKLAAISAVLLLALAAPASAQHVIYNPGWCAQFYPNANCQNYGPGNPYTSYGNSYGWRRTYAWHGYYPRRFHHRYRRY